MAISSKVRESNSKKIVDIESGINGDLLLTRVPQYDFRARKGRIVGYIRDQSRFKKVLYIFKQIF